MQKVQQAYFKDRSIWKIFEKLFRYAEISQLTPAEMKEYKKSIEEYADVQNAMEFAEEKGKRIGEEKEKIQIAQNCLKEGISIETISRLTGLSIEQIKSVM